MKAVLEYRPRNRFPQPVFSPLLLPFLFSTLLSLGCTELDLDQDGWTVEEGDCEDLTSSIYPGALEVCDWWDNNCDGTIDELESELPLLRSRSRPFVASTT